MSVRAALVAQASRPAASTSRSTPLLLALTLFTALSAAAPADKLDNFRRKAQFRLAETAFAAHDIDGAQARLEQALALAAKTDDPAELAPILERLGDVHARRNQLRIAQSFYERALRLQSGLPERQTLDKLGRLAVRRGQYGRAADLYAEALALGEPDAALYLRLGEARLRAGRPDEARDAFDSARAALPTGSLAQAELHESVARRFLWLADDRASAATHADKAFEIRRAHQDDAPDQHLRALRSKAARTSDSQLAETYLQQLPPVVARQIRARRLQAAGDLVQALGQQRSAIQALEAAGDRTLALAEALEAFADLEERRAEDNQAIARRDEALDLRRELHAAAAPSSLRALDKLVANLERENKPDAAESLLTSYIDEVAQVPDNPLPVAALFERLGDFFLRQSRFNEAARNFQQAVELRKRAWGENDGGLQRTLEKHADALRRGGLEKQALKTESQIAFLSVFTPATRQPPQGRRDTGTWLSDPGGLAFVGLALCAASFGLVWLGWTTFTQMQPELEAGFRKPAPQIPEAPEWRPAPRPEALYPVAFRGHGGPLFGIWSVNVALTLLTLGLYFFWGKVRIRRYFWGQAELAGDRFAFHGTGRELLFGWLKAAPFLALVLWGPGLLDLAWDVPNAGLYGAGIAIAVLGLLWPLAEVGASRYRLSRTSWRAIRFSFDGRVWPYLKLWLGGMTLWILTLGLWAPFFDTARRRYMLEHTRFGDARLECDIHGRDLFTFHLVSWVLLPPTLGASRFWYKALAERYYWSRTQLVYQEHGIRTQFECSLKGIDLLVLWIQTMAALSLTLGLGWPWTRIWEARLRLQTITLTGDFRPGRIRQSAEAAGAVGEGAADFLGLDFGFFA
jgi:uncharacterized membrane protein YjgN (DUF898 family)